MISLNLNSAARRLQLVFLPMSLCARSLSSFCSSFSSSSFYTVPSSNEACQCARTATLFWSCPSGGSMIDTFIWHNAFCRNACSRILHRPGLRLVCELVLKCGHWIQPPRQWQASTRCQFLDTADSTAPAAPRPHFLYGLHRVATPVNARSTMTATVHTLSLASLDHGEPMPSSASNRMISLSFSGDVCA